MTIPAFWNEAWTAAVVNHLWQSTVVVGIAWLLALALRKNHARVRYWIWLAASVKFLVPFSLLITAGEWLRSLIPAAGARPAIAAAMEQITQPFPQAQFLDSVGPSVATHHAHLLPVVLAAVWACGALIVLARFGRGWWLALEAKRAARPLELAADVPVLSSPTLIEPGIFGILRPVLLLPEGIVQKLTAAQLSAIIAHEMCHARRRDNLTYSLHMLVEAIFWFHPAVWWIGSRLIDERERACDEAVVQAGSNAQVYAESILNVCKFYVESPVACVSGVTGSDLKKRIVRIMAEQGARRLSLSRILLLCAVVALTSAVPVVLGVIHAQASQTDNSAAQYKNLKFEVCSIRPNKYGGPQIFGKATPDGYEMRNMFMMAAIVTAYPPGAGPALFGNKDAEEGKSWLATVPYDVEAKVPEADLADWQNPAIQPAMLRAMLRNMLADRLKLKVHVITKDEQVYALIVGKKGPRFKESVPGESHPGAFPAPGGGMTSMEIKDGQVAFHYFGISIGQLISLALHAQGRPIQDRTGLKGKYDFTIMKPAPPGAGTPEVRPAETSAAEIANQLGLKLEPSQGEVGTLVIDHVERPSPN